MSKIGKVVELLIDWENLEFDDLGVSILSLVEKPAIGITWQAFNEQLENEEVDPIIKWQVIRTSERCLIMQTL